MATRKDKAQEKAAEARESLPAQEYATIGDVHQDEGESYDAADEGEVCVPEGTDAILYAQMLVDLRDAGFPEDPNDPDGSKLNSGD